MALFGTGSSSQYWRTPARDFSGIGARPIWVSVWTRGANITTTGGLAAFQNASTLIQSAGPYCNNATVSGWDEVDSAGSTDTFTGNVLVANTWQHVLAYYPGASSRAVYFNGVSAASNTVALSGAQSLNTLAVGVVRSTVLGTTRAVAEVAFGTGPLSSDQILALADGRNPLVVAPGQLLGYFPLRGDLADLGPARAGLQPTGGAVAKWTEHPPVAPPPRRRLFAVAAVGGGSVGTATGSGSASGVGASTAASTGTASGSSSASGVGSSLAAATGTASGSSTATGIPPGTSPAVGTASGAATVSGVGASLRAAVGTASGSSTATGIAPGGVRRSLVFVVT